MCAQHQEPPMEGLSMDFILGEMESCRGFEAVTWSHLLKGSHWLLVNRERRVDTGNQLGSCYNRGLGRGLDLLRAYYGLGTIKIYNGGIGSWVPRLISPRNYKTSHEYCLAALTLWLALHVFHTDFISYNPMQFIRFLAPLHRGRNWGSGRLKNLARVIKLQDAWTWQILLSCPPIGLNINTGSEIFRWVWIMIPSRMSCRS